jgi:hypothetical protein
VSRIKKTCNAFTNVKKETLRAEAQEDEIVTGG